MRFLGRVLSTIVGLILFSFLALIIGSIFIAAASSESEVTVSSNSVLHLKLDMPIVEKTADDPLAELGVVPGTHKTANLFDIKKALENAKDDNKIKGIYLESGFVQAGFSTLEEIRDALLDFKKSGKFITFYGEYVSEGGYYLASVADDILLNPLGGIELNGLSANITFYKGALEKLGIEPEIFRVGDFKSAVEPYLRKDMSDSNRVQVNSFLNSLYDHYLNEVAMSRDLDLGKIKTISDSMLVRNSQDAVDLGIATSLAYQDQAMDKLRENLDIEGRDDINFIKVSKYNRSFATSGSLKNRIAVIVASGAIVPGKGDTQEIGSEVYAEEIKKARENDRVKAIILRVNSPGGSILASDVIWRELKLASEVKPVVASMSNVAASGGYYISVACDTIVAQPTTITGSIGIYAMLFNAQEFMNDKLGITTDNVNTGKFSNLFRITSPLSDYEKSIIQKGTNEGYETFISRVAEGRNMNPTDVKAVASGRVWSGSEAKERAW